MSGPVIGTAAAVRTSCSTRPRSRLRKLPGIELTRLPRSDLLPPGPWQRATQYNRPQYRSNHTRTLAGGRAAGARRKWWRGMGSQSVDAARANTVPVPLRQPSSRAPPASHKASAPGSGTADTVATKRADWKAAVA